MKSIAIVSAVLMSFATTASAGDLAVSKSTLQGMGLADMQQLSDQDGLAVRGKGFIDDLFGGGLFDFSFDFPTSTNPPTTNQPESPFDSSPFDNSFMDSFQSGSKHFGSGPSIGGNTFHFGSSAPWSQ